MQYPWQIGFRGKKIDILKLCSALRKNEILEFRWELDECGKICGQNSKHNVTNRLTPNFDMLASDDIAQLVIDTDDAGSRVVDMLDSILQIEPELEVAYYEDYGKEEGSSYLYSKSGSSEYAEVNYDGYRWYPEKNMGFVKKLFEIDRMLGILYDVVGTTDFIGKTFTLIGNFESDSSKAMSSIKQHIGNKRGKVTKTISDKTDYLVIGNLKASVWGSYQAALKQRENGSGIKVITETALNNLLQFAEDTDKKSDSTLLKNDNSDKSVAKTNTAKLSPFAELKKLWGIKILDGDTCTITSYKGNEKAIVIPSEVGKYKVVSISNSNPGRTSKFKSCEIITVSDGIERLEHSAFNDCSSLMEISLPNSLKSIGPFAFSRCISLANVDIPNGVTKLFGTAFDYCDSLESAKISDGITVVEKFTFSGCKQLARIYIQNSKTELEKLVFGSRHSEKLVIYAPSNSKSEQFAKENDIKFEAI